MGCNRDKLISLLLILYKFLVNLPNIEWRFNFDY